MFYLIAAFWIVGCLMVCVVKNARAPHLFITCPCLAAATIIAAIFLYIGDHNLLASVILGIGLFLSFLVLMAGYAKRIESEENG